jgi:hypothetical protein
MKKTTCRINCQKEAVSETINILSSKLEVAQRLSDEIKNLEEEPSFMTEEDTREEERMTFEKLLEPKIIIEEVETLERHPDYLGNNHMKTLQEEIEKKRSFLKTVENAPEDGTLKGNQIYFIIIFYFVCNHLKF